MSKTKSGHSARPAGRRRGAAPLALALEPRLVFDAALAGTALDVVEPSSPSETAVEAAPPPEPVTDDPAPSDSSFPDRDVSGVREIVFVDSRVRDADVLLGTLPDWVDVVRLDAGRDAVAQITDTLAGRRDLAALHILSHGGEGTLTLGAGTLNSAVVMARSDQVAAWGDALADGADIVLYGCEVAGSETGRAFVGLLADLTGADVAASQDATGAAELGGDWVLELRTGTIEAGLAMNAADYGHLLAAPAFDATNAALAYTEGAGAVAADSALTLTAPGTGTANPVGAQVRITAGFGAGDRLQLATTNGISGAWNAATGTLTLSHSGGTPTVADYQAALRAVTFEITGDHPTATGTSRTLTFEFTYNDGSADQTVSDTRAVTVAEVNDAPSNPGDVNLSPIDEGTQRTGNAGTLVSALIGAAGVTDAEQGTAIGIAVVLTDATRGTWEYTTDGSTWLDVGPRAAGNALLLASDASTRVRFVPADTDYAGSATFAFRLWDKTEGAAGGTHDITATGGSSAFSANTATATIQVVDVNDAPVLSGTGLILPAITEDVADGSNAGMPVTRLLSLDATGDLVTDIDTGASLGVAITATGGLGGTWQYSADGTTWTDFPTIAAGNALLLSGGAFVRFKPGPDSSGEATITYRAWDASSGTAFATAAVATLGTGGTAPLSTGEITSVLPVTSVNDDPVIGTSGLTVSETAARSGTGIALTSAMLGATDVDNTNPAQLVYRVEALAAGGELLMRYGTVHVAMEVGSTFTQADIAAGNVRYRYTGAELAADAVQQFRFTLRDGAGAVLGDEDPSAAADPQRFLTVTVTDVNAAIDIATSSVTVSEYVPGITDQIQSITLSFTDADAAAGSRSVTIGPVDKPALGRLEYSLDGTTWTSLLANRTFGAAELATLQLRFVQTADAPEPSGTDAYTDFSVEASDGRGSTDTQTVRVNIAAWNDPPANDPSATALTITEGDNRVLNRAADNATPAVHLSVVDGDSNTAEATYTITAATTKGGLYRDGVRLGVGSTFSQADLDAGLVRYIHEDDTPDANPATADDSFGYVVRDVHGGSSAGTFEIFVTPVDDAPVPKARDVYVGISGNTGVSDWNLFATDPDTAAASLTYTVTGLAGRGSFRLDGAEVTTFTQADVSAGRVTYHDATGTIGTFTVNVSVSDGTTLVALPTLTIHVVSGGSGGTDQAPEVTANAPLVVAEGSAGNAIGGTLLYTDDREDGPADVVYTLQTAPARGTLWLDADGNGIRGGGETLADGGTFTQKDIDDGKLRYDHDGSETTSDQFTFDVVDRNGNHVLAGRSFSILVTPVNDAPAIVPNGGTLPVAEHDDDGTAGNPAAFDLTGVENAVKLTTAVLGVSDAESATTSNDQYVYVVVTKPGGGDIKVWRGGAWQILTDGGRFSQTELAAGNVAYFHDPAKEPDASRDRVVVRLVDGGSTGGGEATSANATVAFNVTPVNDAPGASGGSFTIAEGATRVLGYDTEIDVSDSDTDPTTLTYRVTQAPGATAGRLWLDANGNGTYDDGEALSAGGTFTRQDLLDGKVRYTHLGNEVFEDSFRVRAVEPGPGLESGDATVSVFIRPANEAPGLAGLRVVPVSAAYEGQAVVLTDTILSAVDPETYNPSDPTLTQRPELVQFRLTTAVQHGRLVVDNGTTVRPLGVNGVFTMADVLNGHLKYIHDGSENHADGFGIIVSDGSGGAEPAGTVTINVQAVNDSPVLTAPNGYAVDEDTTLALTGIGVSDVDVGISGTVTVTLAVASGVLTVRTDVAGGLTGAGVANNASGTVTLSGTVAAINATLAASGGLSYRGGTNFSGTDNLVVTVSDLGGTGTDPSVLAGLTGSGQALDGQTVATPETGTGTDQQATKTIAITVRPVNDQPTLAGTAASPTATESGSGTPNVRLVQDGSAAVTDPDVAAGTKNFSGATVTVSFTDEYRPGDLLSIANEGTGPGQVGVSGGNISYGGTVVGTVSGGDAASLVVTFNGEATDAAIAAVVEAIQFRNTGEDPLVKGTDSTRAFRVVFNDGGNVGAGGPKSAATILTGTITLVNENDAPVLSAHNRNLASIAEDNTTSTGTLVSAILTSNSGTATDADDAAVGILVTAVTDTNGYYEYSTDGTNWTRVSTQVTAGFGLLLRATDKVRFVPDQHFNSGNLADGSTGGITFRAWDQSTNGGAAGQVAHTEGVTATGDTTAYSGTAATAGITVTAVNDAPGLTGTTESPTVTESGSTTNAVALVQAGTVTVTDIDVPRDATNFSGARILVTFATYRSGDRLFVTDAGAVTVSGSTISYSGTVVGTISGGSGNALTITLNSSSSAAAAQAIVEAVRFRHDGDDPTAKGASPSRSFSIAFEDGGNVGGGALTSASLTGTITVVGENDAPVLSAHNRSLASIAEDNTTSTGTLVSAILTSNSGTVTDADNTSPGILVTAVNDTNGYYEYSTDGTNWTRVSTQVTAGFGLLLRATDKVRFVPDQHFNSGNLADGSTGGLTFRAWDRTTNGGAAGQVAYTEGVTAVGTTTAYSGTAATAAITVTAVNDAPVLAGTAANPSATETGNQTDVLTLVTGATLADIDVPRDATGFVGATLTVRFTDAYQTGDRLSVANIGTAAGQVGVSGSNVTYGGTTVGTFSGGDAGALTITFTASADAAAVAAVVNALRYQNTTDNPTAKGTDLSRAYEIVFSDGGNVGSPGALSSSAITGTITFTAENDAPTLTATAGNTTFTEANNVTSTPVAVDGGIVVGDVDNATLAQAEVRISGNYNATQDLLAFTNGNAATFGNITASWNAATGTLTLTSAGATATLAQFQAALRAVTYTNSSDTPDTANRTVDFRVQDQDGAWSGTGTQTVLITPVNDTPQLDGMGGTLSWLENAGHTVIDGSVTLTDLDSPDFNAGSLRVSLGGTATAADQLGIRDQGAGVANITLAGSDVFYGGVRIGSVHATFNGANGSDLLITLDTANATVAAVKALAENVTFSNTSENPTGGNRTATFTVVDGDGGADTDTATATIAVTPVNDAPRANGLGDTLAFREGDAAKVIDVDGSVTLADDDSADFDGGSLRVQIPVSAATVGDQLSIRNQGSGAGQIGYSSGVVYYQGVQIGTVTGDGSRDMTVTFDADATQAAVAALIRNVTFYNGSENPGTTARTVTFTLVDGDGTANGGQDTDTDTATVTVEAVNDLPTIIGLDGGATFVEDGPAVVIDGNATISDADLGTGGNASYNGTRLSIQRSGGANAQDVLGFSTGGALFAVSGTAASGTLTSGGQAFATYTQTGGVLTVDFSGASATATRDLVNDVLRHVTYANSSDTPPASVTLAVTFADGNAGNAQGTGDNPGSITQTVAVAITPVNDAPTLSGTGQTPTATESGTGTNAVQLVTGGGVSDPDAVTFAGAVIRVRFTDGYQAGDRLFLASAPTGVASVTGGGAAELVITLDAGATQANFGAILEAIRYENTGDNPTAYGADTRREFQIVFNDGGNSPAPGRDATNTLTGHIDLVGENDAPTAVNDAATIAEDAVAPVTGSVRTNDGDLDHTVLTVTAIRTQGGTVGTVGTGLAGTYGTLTQQADGTYSYAIDNANTAVQALAVGQTLTDAFVYTISDGNGGTATATLTVTIQGTNDVPVAVADTATIAEDAVAPATGTVLANDSDTDTADTLTVTAIRTQGGTVGTVGTGLAGTYGTLTQQANGTYSYAIDNANTAVQALAVGQTLTDAFVYTISDGNGGTTTATLTVTIQGTNDVPVAVADTATIAEDAAAPAAGTVLANDSDPDTADTLTVTAIRTQGGTVGTVGTGLAGTYGTLTQQANGTYSYAIDNANTAVQALAVGQTLTDAFVYTISDGNGGTTTATLTVTIQGTNDVPVAVADTATIAEDAVAPATGTVLANDSDTDTADTLTVTAIRTQGGTVGTVGTGLAGTYGTLTQQANGTYSYAIDNANTAVQALAAGQTLTDAFVYTISDGNGGTATATLTVTIQGTNDVPVAVADTATIAEDAVAPATGTVLANDSDTDTADTLTVTAIRTQGGTVGTVGTGLAGTYGTLTQQANGTYSYAIDNANTAVQALAVGQTLTDAFVYTISDGNGGTTTATLTVTIQGTNDVPVAVADTATIAEDAVAPATGTVLANDSDPDTTDTLNVTAIRTQGGTVGTVGTGLAGTYGTLTQQANGTYSYAIDNADTAVQALAVGQTLTDAFVYTISDGNGGTTTATLTVTIQGTNDTPVAVADAATIMEGATVPATGTVRANDSDPDATDTLNVTAIRTQGGTVGTVGTGLAGAYGTLMQQADGTYSYAIDNANAAVQALAAGQTLTDAFVYTIADNNGGTATATLTVTIQGANNPPVAVADTATIAEDAAAPAIGTVLANDQTSDNGETLSVSAIRTQGGTVGTVGTGLTGTYGTLTQQADGTYSYAIDNANAAVQALAVGQTLTDAFVYTLSDGQGSTATATLTVTIQGTNDTPVAVADTATIAEDAAAPAAGTVLANDSDPDTADTLTVTAIRTQGGTVGTVGTGLAGTYGTLTQQANGTYSYAIDNTKPAVQALAAGQTLTDAFVYTISDGNGGMTTATLTVTVQGTDDAPVAVTDTATVAEDAAAPATGTVLANDRTSDDGETLSVSAIRTQGGTAGTVGTGLAGTYGTLTQRADGTYSYALDNANAAVQALAVGQTLTDAFVYTLSDGQGGTTTATLTVTIQGTNDVPVAVADTATTAEDAAVPATGTVLANDSDTDTADTLTVTAIRTQGGTAGAVGTGLAGTYGTLTQQVNGTYSYAVDNAAAAVQALAAGQTLTDAFVYTVSDGNGGTTTATLTVTIQGTNDAPVPLIPLPDATGAELQPVALTVPAGAFGDVDGGDVLTLSARLANGDPLPSWLVFDPVTRTFGGTPQRGDAATYAIVVTATDLAGATGTSTFSLRLDASPAPPPSERPPVEPPPPPPPPPPPDGPPGNGGLITPRTDPSQDGLFTPVGQDARGRQNGADALSFLRDVGNGRTQGLELFVAGTVGNQVMLAENNHSFQVPKSIFRHTNQQERLTYEAKRPDGTPLPSWLQFDAENLSFSGTPPADATGTVEISIVARDARGNEATAQFRVTVGRDVDGGLPGENPQDAGPPPPEAEGLVPGEPIPAEPGTDPASPPAAGPDGAPDGAPNGPAGEGEPAEEAPGRQAVLEGAGIRPIQVADAWTLATDAGSEGPASFAAQLRVAGRQGLIAEGRAILESLARAAAPASATGTADASSDTGRSAA